MERKMGLGGYRYTGSHPNPSSSPGYPNLDLMMASRDRNMSSYN